jgi:chromosome segregation ATPase
MTAPSRSIRYATEEERKDAKAATTRRYRERQRQLLSSIAPSTPTLQQLRADIESITNRYRHQSDHLESLQAQVVDLQAQVSLLQDTTVSTSQLEGFRDTVIAEFKRLEKSVSVPILVTHTPRT